MKIYLLPFYFFTFFYYLCSQIEIIEKKYNGKSNSDW